MLSLPSVNLKYSFKQIKKKKKYLFCNVKRSNRYRYTSLFLYNY